MGDEEKEKLNDIRKEVLDGLIQFTEELKDVDFYVSINGEPKLFSEYIEERKMKKLENSNEF